MITKTASIAAAALAAAALVVALTHAGPRGATGAPGPRGLQGTPGIAQNLDGGYTSECNQPMTSLSGNSVTYYFPCSPVPQNPADQ
jgi:hypothetical protein